MEMLDIAGLSFLSRLVHFCAASLAVMLLLRWWDILNKQSFTAALEIINADPRALADYRGKRLVALCLLAGLILS